MNERNDPSLKWFEIVCGRYKVGTWATNLRAAKKKVSASGHNPIKHTDTYNNRASGMTTIVL
jgi:hypothetical protein